LITWDVARSTHLQQHWTTSIVCVCERVGCDHGACGTWTRMVQPVQSMSAAARLPLPLGMLLYTSVRYHRSPMDGRTAALLRAASDTLKPTPQHDICWKDELSALRHTTGRRPSYICALMYREDLRQVFHSHSHLTAVL